MKVERQKAKPTFEPIVITLETKEEADFLWYFLANPVDWTYRVYTKHKLIALGIDLKIEMWMSLNEVFHPTTARL